MRLLSSYAQMIICITWLVIYRSSLHHPKSQRCGLSHTLADEDVLQIVTLTVKQQRREADYATKVQAIYDERKKKKKALKS